MASAIKNALAVTALALGGAVHAAPITYDFAGVFTQVEAPGLGRYIKNGDLFTGTFTVLPSARTPAPSGDTHYLNSVKEILMTVGNTTYTTVSANVGLRNEDTGDSFSVYGQSVFRPAPLFPATFVLTTMSFAIDDNSFLRPEFPDFAELFARGGPDLESIGALLFRTDAGYLFSANFDITSINRQAVTTVPEPASLALVALGLVGLAVRRRAAKAAA